MNTTSANIFDTFATRDEFLGFGYIGERRHFTQWEGQAVREADAAILEAAAELGWDEDRLFQWANSKDGRWFADEAFGMRSLARAMKYVR